MSATASAPGKVILFGEHAVVYGRPAIAVPVEKVRATARIDAGDGGLWIQAADLGRSYLLEQADPDDPLAAAVWLTLEAIDARPPDAVLAIHSTIPISSGLGSGAAVSVAIIRALAQLLGNPLSDDLVSDLAFQVEKFHHGTPSGIDNTVVTFRRPVFFVRDQPIQTLQVRKPLRLLIADTGVPSPTKVVVGDVRAAWKAQPARYDALFDAIGRIALRAKKAIENGKIFELGPLMTQNQLLLEQLGVSSVTLERLIQVALDAGADGAKLSGAGRGGNLIAAVRPEVEDAVAEALRQAGAVNLIPTLVWEGRYEQS